MSAMRCLSAHPVALRRFVQKLLRIQHFAPTSGNGLLCFLTVTAYMGRGRR